MQSQTILVTGSSGFIGSRFMQWGQNNNLNVIGLDIKPPVPGYIGEHHLCDILDRDRLVKIVKQVSPNSIIHLAARTDLDGKTVAEYSANSTGIVNLLYAISETSSVERCLFISSQLVCKVGYLPTNDLDYCPPNPYGESKVLTENIVRESDGGGVTWCLLRPTTIWGPGMNSHYSSFFNHLRAGRYFHMGTSDLWKSYGFVGNTVFQIGKFLSAPSDLVHRKVFYLADYEPLSLRNWIDAISLGMGRGGPRTLPLPLCKLAAFVGDAFKGTRIERYYPLNSFRLNNILTEYQFSLESTQAICGKLPYDNATGIEELLDWVGK